MDTKSCFACGGELTERVCYHLKDGTKACVHAFGYIPPCERISCETYIRRHPEVDLGPHARFKEPLPEPEPTWRDKLADWIRS